MERVKLLDEGVFYELQVYKNKEDLPSQATPLTGALRQHYHPHMVYLITEPLDPHCVIYEIRSEDILHAEKETRVTRPDGMSIEMVTLWIEKKSIVMKMEPIKL